MKTQREIIGEYLHHPDSWYFSFSDDMSDDLEFDVASQKFEGLAINGPGKIDIAQYDRIPMVFLSQSMAFRQWQVVPYSNTKIIGVNLDNGEITVKHAFQTGKRRYTANLKASGEGRPPEGDLASHQDTKVAMLDMAEVMGFAMTPAHYIFRVVNFDWLSNAVEVGLFDSKRPPQKDIAIPRHEAAEFAVKTAANPDELPVYHKTNHSPLLNDRKLAIHLSSDIHVEKPVIVSGSFELPLLRNCLVEKQAGDANESPANSEGIPVKMPQAIMRLALFFAKLDELNPRVIDINYPIYSATELKPGQTISGNFELDANKDLTESLQPGKYLVYLIGGREMSDPMHLTIH